MRTVPYLLTLIWFCSLQRLCLHKQISIANVLYSECLCKGVSLYLPSPVFCTDCLTLSFSHINQKTQFENPVQEAKKKLSQDASPTSQPIAAAAGAVPTPLSKFLNFFCFIPHFLLPQFLFYFTTLIYSKAF